MDPINQLEMDSVKNVIASFDSKTNRKTSSFVEACYLFSDNKCFQVNSKRRRHFSSSAIKNDTPHYLPPLSQKHLNKKTLVLDLDETLVHSTFDPINNYDCKIPIEIEGSSYDIYALIRPGVSDFLREMSKNYELVIYTASLEIYANPLISYIDSENLISYKLYREHCVFLENFYIKDLSLLGRDLKNVVIIDNCAESFSLNTYNGITIKSWYGNKEDIELSKLIPFLNHLSKVEDVRRDIMKFVSEDTLIYEKLLKETPKATNKENRKNTKSISLLSIPSNTEYSDSKIKKDEKGTPTKVIFTVNTVSKNLVKSNRNKVNDLKHFSTIILKKKENNNKKSNSGQKFSFSGITTNSPIVKSPLEQTNTTFNYSNLETTINKVSSNSSNNGNKQSSVNNTASFSKKNSIQHNKTWKIFTEVSSYISKANNERKILRNSNDKREKIEGGKSVILNNQSFRSRNKNFHYMNTSYFNIEDKSINYYTQISESGKNNYNTPIRNEESNKLDINYNSRENSSKKSMTLNNYMYNSFTGKKEHSLKETRKLILSQNLKDLNLDLTIKKKHNVSFSEKEKSSKNSEEIRSYCKVLLRKNEAQFSSLFKKSKCKKTIIPTLKSSINTKKNIKRYVI